MPIGQNSGFKRVGRTFGTAQHGDLTIIYPKSYSIYLMGTTALNLQLSDNMGIIDHVTKLGEQYHWIFLVSHTAHFFKGVSFGVCVFLCV